MKRIIAILLAVSLVASLIVPVSAASSDTVVEVEFSKDLVDIWDNHFNDLWAILGGESIGVLSGYFINVLWEYQTTTLNNAGYGKAPSLEALHRRADWYNKGTDGLITGITQLVLNWGYLPEAVVLWVETLDAYVICDKKSGAPIVNRLGAYAYYREETPQDKWLGSRSCDINGKVVLLTEDVLSNLCLTLNQTGESCTVTTWGNQYYVIQKDNYYYYCNPDGLPYVARIEESSHAVNSPNNYYTDSSGDNIYNTGDTNNSTLIDNSTSTVLTPSGDINFIDQLIYDAATKTYHVDARTQYDITNNTYQTNNYLYQYHIDYTSITYIGQTEEYEEEYKFYYELPDGRSSADLTKEDLEQLSIAFADVVNYARSADDLSQRVLYHFDGNVSDSSYWSYASKFEWANGASLTYMDEGVFNGSLYLDETIHDFTITLPGNDAAGDFTLQFRYYQSYTATPQEDSYLYIGGDPVLTFTGAAYLDKAGESICATSIGSWNEICIMRKDGVLHYFINGVPLRSVEDSVYHSGKVHFIFGSDQQTYKKLDELRFTKGTIYEPDANYTPTSVPFDSNLSLILPDGERPLADEVMVFTPGSNNIFTQYGMDDWTSSGVLGDLNNGLAYGPFSGWRWNSKFTSLSYQDGAVNFACNPGSPEWDEFGSGLYVPLFRYYRGDESDYYQPLDDPYDSVLYGVNTLSLVLSDGSYSSCTIDYSGSSPRITSSVNSAIQFELVTYWDPNCYDDGYSGDICLRITAPVGTTARIIYAEFVQGTEPAFSVGWENAVYSSGELDKAPVLAVRSNLPVTGYQFGGVRPSYPELGQVWALVENSRITSLQQYTGYAWESVDGRIWTGERWIPYYAFDVMLLKDMYDIIEADPSQDFIYTQEGFWKWLQNAWAEMLDKLDQIIIALGGSAGDPDKDPAGDLVVDDDPVTDEDDGWSFIDLLVTVKDGAWDFTTGIVSKGFGGLVSFASSLGRVSDFFDSYSKGNEGVFGIVNYGGSDIWD